MSGDSWTDCGVYVVAVRFRAESRTQHLVTKGDSRCASRAGLMTRGLLSLSLSLPAVCSMLCLM